MASTSRPRDTGSASADTTPAAAAASPRRNSGSSCESRGPDRRAARPGLALEPVADLEGLPRPRRLQRLQPPAALSPRRRCTQHLALGVHRPQLGQVPVQVPAQHLQQRRHAVLDADRVGEQVDDGLLGRLVLLRPVALGDVLDHARDAVRAAGAVARQRRPDLGPARHAVGGQVAMTQVHGVDLARDQRRERARVHRPVVRMHGSYAGRPSPSATGIPLQRAQLSFRKDQRPLRSVWNTMSSTASTTER